MPPLAAFLLLVLTLAGFGEFVSIFGLHAVIQGTLRFGLILSAAAVVQWFVQKLKQKAGK